MSFMAYAKPAMLMTSPAPKTTDGTSRENPSVLPRAMAQTASNSPETMSTIHAMANHRFPSVAVLSLAGYGSLVRWERAAPAERLAHPPPATAGHDVPVLDERTSCPPPPPPGRPSA